MKKLLITLLITSLISFLFGNYIFKVYIKNVKETVLKFSIVMGIIMSCAEKVMLKASAILFFIFNFTNISLMFLLNIIIPTVPINESFNPMSFIANGF